MKNKYLSFKRVRLAMVIAVIMTALSVNGQTTYYSRTGSNLDFADPNSWTTATNGTGGTSPVSVSNADNFEVRNGTTMVLSTTANVRQLTISATNTAGSLTVNTGANLTVSVATANTNNTFMTVSGGTLNVTGGTVTVNGNFNFSSGNYTQSGGAINVDGTNTLGTSATGSLVNFTASSTYALSGGTLTIVDPAASTAQNAFNYSGTSTIVCTGTYKVRFGNGSSTQAGSADGFLVNNGTTRFNFRDLEINGTNLATNRHVKMNLTSNSVLGTMTVNANSSYQCNTYSLYLAGDLVNNGTIVSDGTGTDGLRFQNFSTGTAAAVTVAQSVTGTGTIQNAVSTPTANTTNLFVQNTSSTGLSIATTGNFISGVGTGTISGTFTLIAGLIDIGSTGVFTMGISTATTGTFTYTAGGFLNGTFGRWWSAAQTGTAISASADPSSATSRYPFTAAGSSPSATANRSAWIERTSGTVSGGIIRIKYTDASTFAVPGTAIADVTPTYSVNLRTDANWVVSTAGGYTSTSGVFELAVVTPGLITPTVATGPRLVPINGPTPIGTYQGGTITGPCAQRGALTLAQLTGQAWYFGLNQNDFTYQTIATGNWSATSTWAAGLVPASTNNAIINTGHNVTIDASTNVCNSLTIASGGTLTGNNAANALAVTATTATTGITNNGTINLSNGTITVGTAGGGISLFTNASGGSLNVSGGTLNLNGQAVIANGSNFSQSGGNINVDPNSGTAGTSVAASTNIFSIGTGGTNYATGTISLTGGTLTLADLPNSGTGISFAYFGSAAQNFTASTAHTLRTGDGTAGSTTTSTSGFLINGTSVSGGGRLVLGTVTVNGTTAARFTTPGTSTINDLYATDLTINAASEMRVTAFGGELRILRNLSNSGTLTTFENCNFAFGGVSGNADAVSSNAQSITTSSGTFRNNTTTPTGNFGSVTINNNSPSGVTFNIGNFSITGSWTQTAGLVNIGSSNTLTIGTSSQLGSINWTAGGVTDGSIARNIPSSTVVSTAAQGLFPFTNGTDVRNAQIGFSTGPGTGGTITIKHNNAAGFTAASFTDASGTPSIGISQISNSNWSIFATTLNYSGTLGTLTLRGDNALTVSTFANVRAVNASAAAPGVSSAGTGSNSNPVANKASLAIADWGTSGSPNVLYIGQPRNLVSNATNGNWSDPFSWVPNTVPTTGDIVTILAGHTITVDATSVANDLTINATGALVNSANTLTVSNNISNSGTVTLSGTGIITHGLANGGSAAFTNASGGTLTISGGTLNVNGNLLIANGSSFSQSAGNINIDGNSGSSTTSVGTGVHLFAIGQSGNSHASGTISLTGGQITIIDPQFNATGDAVYYNSTTSRNLPAAFTFQLGGNGSTTAGGNTFNLNTFASSGRLAFGNVIVAGGVGTNRWVTNTYEYGILGDLTINAGGQLRATSSYLHVAGNITVNGDGTSTVANNGILTSSSTVYLDVWTGGSSSPTTNAQTIGGSGYFTNNTTTASSTANFTGLSINNTSSSGVTFSNANSLVSVISGLYTNTGTVSGTSNGLLMVAGKVNLGGNTFILGVSNSSGGALTYNAGGFVGGTVRRWVTNSSISLPAAGSTGLSSTFPFINSTGQARFAHYAQSSTITSGGWVQVQFNDASTTSSVSINDGVAIGVRSDANWVVTTGGGLTYGSGTGSLRIRGDGYSITNFTDARIIGASGVANGTSGAGTNSNAAPEANKTAYTVATLAGTYYFGVPSIKTSSVAAGDWNDPFSWSPSGVPLATDNIIILNGHNITLATAADVANSVTINSGGTLTGAVSDVLTISGLLSNAGTINAGAGTINVGTTVTNNGIINISGGILNATSASATYTSGSGSQLNISAGTFNYGPTGGGKVPFILASGNTFALTGTGTFNVGGYVSINGGTFTFTGGNFSVDANDGTAGGSYTGGDLFTISLTTPISTVTGGTLTIVDPPYSGTNRAFATSGSGSDITWVGNTLRLGGTTGTNSTISSSGFIVDTYVGTGVLRLGNVEVNGGNTTDRVVFTSQATNNATVITNLTINSGSELRNSVATSFYIAGNITNNGTLTVANATTLNLGSVSGTSTFGATTLQQTISGNGTWRNATTGSTASISNLRINNTYAGAGAGIICNVNNLSVCNVSSNGTLTWVAGKIDLGSNTFTLGISAGIPGTLTYTAGGFTGGTFSRWFATGQVTLGTVNASGFPFISTTGNNDRTVYFGTNSTASTGGKFSVKYTDGTGTTVLTNPITDGVTLDNRSNAYWTVTGNTFNFNTSTGQLQFLGTGIYGSIQVLNNVRVVPADGPSPAPGTSGNGSGSLAAPRANKSALVAGDLAGTDFYFSSPSVVVSNTFAGDWGDPFSWSPVGVPTSADNVSILAGHNITLNVNGAASSLAIASTGTLTANANTLTIGGSFSVTGTLALGGATITNGNVGGGNSPFTLNNGGTLNMSAGALNVNGRFLHNPGATLIQSGGAISVDGNAAGVVASSVPASSSIVSINRSSALPGTITLTGGTFTIVDPHADPAGTSTMVFTSDISSQHVNAGANHTFILGNGTSTDAGGNAIGFRINPYNSGFSLFAFGKLIVNGSPSGANRTVTIFNPKFPVLSDLTITSGGYLNGGTADVYVGGNLTVNTGSTFITPTANVFLANYSSNTLSASTNNQVVTVNGTGSIANAVSSATANFTNLTINNSNATGVSIASLNTIGTGSISGTLTLTAGRIALGTNTLTLGISTTTPGTLSYTAGGFISGTFNRWYPTTAVTIGNIAGRYPFISSTNDRSAYFGTSGATSGGTVSVNYNDVAGISTVSSFNDLGVDVSKISNAYWTVANTFSYGASTGLLRLQGDGIFGSIIVADMRITGASASANGTSAAGTGTSANPQGNKTGYSSGVSLSGNYYLAVPSLIQTSQPGFWNTPGTWVGGIVPTANDAVLINAGHTVTLDAPGGVASALTINATGALTVAANTLTLTGNLTNNGTVTLSGGTITQGTTGGGNADYTNNSGATLTVSSGTYNLNGSFSIDGGTFNQSGGTIIVDGNANNVAANSVANQPIVSLISATYNLTGGTLIVVDPHVDQANYESLRYNSSSNYNAGSGHTLQFGNGTSTTPGLTNVGIEFDPFYGTGRIQFGNIVVNTATGANRIVRQLDNFGLSGNLTLTTGEYTNNAFITYINGNLTVNTGTTLTADGTIALANYASGSQTASTNAQTISGGGTFRNALTGSTASFSNLVFNNTNATGITISPNNLSVSGTLALTAGKVALGTNTLTLGTAIATPGTLSYTAGGFISGTFNRWYGTTAVTLGNVAGRYPFISGTDNRSAYFGTSGAITGGTLAVKYTDAAGTSPVSTPFSDGGVGIAKASNAFWTLSQSINLGTSTALLRLNGNNITTVTDFTAVRITSNTGSVPGASIAGTGSNTAPEANKTAMAATNLAGNLRIGYPNYLVTSQPGDWNTPATWVGNVVPTAGDNATILNNHTVTVTGTSVAATLVINSGGGLSVTGGSLTMGGGIANSGTYNQSGGTVTLGTAGGGNAVFDNVSSTTSNFTISAGTLNINGNLDNVSNTFTQTGGTIIIDGNSGTAATSVPEATDLCYIAATTINCSAGTIRIVDPPHSSYVSQTRALVINSAASATAFSGTHTVEFGDGLSTTPGYTSGFIIETYNSGRVPLRNVTVNAGSGTNRFVYGSLSGTSYGTHINGTLTINSGSEVRTNTNGSEFALGGNIVNNGTFTVEKEITLGSIGTYTVTTPQTISGTGVFRNLSVSPTANYTSIYLNNSGGVTFATSQSVSGTGTGTISGTLTMNLGNIAITSGTFTLGISATTPGTLTYNAGYITGGSFARWIGTSALTLGNNAGRYPFGSGSNDRSFYVGTSGAITTGGTVAVNYTDGIGTTPVTPFSDAGSTITSRSNASWAVSQSGLSLGSSTLLTRIQANGVGTVTDFTASRMVFSSAVGNGISVAGTGSNGSPQANKTAYTTSNLAGTYYYGIGSITCLPPSNLAATPSITSANLSWTAGGSEPAWDIELMLASANPTGTPTASGVTNPYNAGSLTAGTSYKYYVRAACGGGNGTSAWVGPFAFSTLFSTAPNDFITTATTLTVNNVAVFGTYSNTGATLDGTPTISSPCETSISNDVWFKATVPAQGTLAVYFRASTVSPALTDMVLNVYTSSDNSPTGTLTQVACSDDEGAGLLPFSFITGLTPGNTVYIRASDFNTVDIGSFDIAVTPFYQWTGATNTTWTTAGNWLSTDAAPSATTDNICVPNGLTNYPVNSAGTGINSLFTQSGATITNNGSNLTVRGDITASNTQFGGTGYVVLTGTANQTISGNGNTYTNLRMNKTGGTATVATGANMQTITSVFDLRSGTINANGNITIQSTALTQAYIDDFSSGNTGTVTGNVKVERYITNGPTGFRYISAPVNTGGSAMNLSAISGFTITGTPGFIIPLANCDPNNVAWNSPYGNFMRWEENGNGGNFQYNCRQAGWFFQTSGSMTLGRGYGAKISSGQKITYTGTANTGNINYGPLANTTTIGNGWHLVSNPYPSSIAISNTDGPTTNNMPAGFDGQIQFYLTSGPYTGTYLAYNVGLTTAPIALGQGFWVHVTSPSTGIWAMTNAYRTTTNATYYDVNSPVQEHLKVDVAGNNFMDQTDINFVADAQTGFDFFDANKWMSANGQPTLYTTVGSEMLSINSLPSLTNTAIVPMGFNPGANGNFTLTFSDIASFPASAMISLEDLQLGITQDLRANNTYAFSSTTNDNADRFVIHFQPGVQTQVVDADCDNAGSITITQPGTTVWDSYTVKDNANNLYTQGTNFTGTLTINNLQPQEYIVTLTHSTGYVAQEFITVNGIANTISSTVNASATNVYVNEVVTLTGNATNATDYTWNFGDNTVEAGTTLTQHAYATAGVYNVTFTASNENCSDVAVKTITVTTPTGVIDSKAETLNIYGSGNHVVIEFNNWGSNEADIFMYNTLGQRVETLTGVSTLKGRHEINITDIKPGYYLIQVSSNGKVEGKKVFLGSN